MSLGAIVFLVLLVGKLGFEWEIGWVGVFLPLVLEAVVDVVVLVFLFLEGRKLLRWLNE